MNLLTTLLAGAGLLICIFLAIHMSLSPRRRQQLDAHLRDAGRRMTQFWRGRRFKKSAANEAEAAIRRAQGSAAKPEGEWDGNVYRPKRFGEDKPRKPH
ncbi:hypothetical protein [Roseateles sp.]|uniref:hypothetical protein n=1 Tax=Roseateles sp. TaxID=1971397 RepID=UPI00286AD675|nr:hypothetical protein [Roseateles sp.]